MDHQTEQQLRDQLSMLEDQKRTFDRLMVKYEDEINNTLEKYQVACLKQGVNNDQIEKVKKKINNRSYAW